MSEAATPGLTLRTPEGTAYRFDPGALCLELLTTGGPGPYARYEVLHEPADLAAWAARSRLDPAPAVAADADGPRSARRLRDALWRLASARAGGRGLAAEDLSVLNEAAAAPPLTPRLTEDAACTWEPSPSAAALLSTVARDAIGLLTGPYAHRIRECAAGDCYLLFVDTSRPGRRRWCSMERCGNRHKVRSHRERNGE